MGDEQVIWDLIDRSNDAWTVGRIDAVTALYFDDAVLVGTELGLTVKGRDAIVATYEQFMTAATVKKFQVIRRSLHLTGETAIAAYVFEIVYTMNGQSASERGEEILVMQRRGDGWKATWRTQIPL